MFRLENWTFNGIPTAQLVSLGFIAVGLGALVFRHRPGREADGPATRWRRQTWGAIGTVPEGAAAELDEDDDLDDEDLDDDWDEDDDGYDDDGLDEEVPEGVAEPSAARDEAPPAAGQEPARRDDEPEPLA